MVAIIHNLVYFKKAILVWWKITFNILYRSRQVKLILHYITLQFKHKSLKQNKNVMIHIILKAPFLCYIWLITFTCCDACI